MKSNSVILIIFLQFLVFGNLFCQNDSLKINSLYAGSKSIQFRITSNLTLSDFNGGNISAKYHLSNKKAVRIGVTLDAGKSESDNKKISGGEEFKDDNSNEFLIGIDAQYLYFPKINNRVTLFIGVGPEFSYQYYEGKGELSVYKVDTLSFITNSSNKRAEYNIGISLIAGVEVFILKYLSIHAEYSSFAYYRYYKSDSFSITDYTDAYQENTGSIYHSESSSYFLRAHDVLFGLSIYF
ncbi:MAG: outer membrane beta-barrel protein [Calditrichaceae bacterium]|nr:outer membrane beta-barrel protein [Calditrichaceae bacterium]